MSSSSSSSSTSPARDLFLPIFDLIIKESEEVEEVEEDFEFNSTRGQDLSKHLASFRTGSDDVTEQVTVERLLLRECRKQIAYYPSDGPKREGRGEKQKLQLKVEEKQRKRMAANIRVIGILYKWEAIRENSMTSFIRELVESQEKRRDASLEALYLLLPIVGQKLEESPQLKGVVTRSGVKPSFLQTIFVTLSQIERQTNPEEIRLRALILKLTELSQNKWRQTAVGQDGADIGLLLEELILKVTEEDKDGEDRDEERKEKDVQVSFNEKRGDELKDKSEAAKKPIEEHVLLDKIFSLIFEINVHFPESSQLHANLCKYIASYRPKKSTVEVKILLMNKCQEMFENEFYEGMEFKEMLQQIIQCKDKKLKKRLDVEFKDFKRKEKQRYFSSIRLIGELFNANVLGLNVAFTCLKRMLSIESEESLDRLSLCLTIIGEKLELESKEFEKRSEGNHRDILDPIYERLTRLSFKVSISLRVRALLEDVLEKRYYFWAKKGPADEGLLSSNDQLNVKVNIWEPFGQTVNGVQDGPKVIILRKVTALLNKLTPNNGTALLRSAQVLQIREQDVMQAMVDLVMKAVLVDLGNTLEMFALFSSQVCRMISEGKAFKPTIEGQVPHLPRDLVESIIQKEKEEKGEDQEATDTKCQQMSELTFGKLLSNRCLKIFEAGFNLNVDPECDPKYLREDGKGGFKFFLRNLRFLGELFKANLLPLDDMVLCLETLVGNNEKFKQEKCLQSFCALYVIIGEKLEVEMFKKSRIELINALFVRLSLIFEENTCSPRIRFLLQNAMDSRKSIHRKNRIEPIEVKRKAEKVSGDVELQVKPKVRAKDIAIPAVSSTGAVPKKRVNILEDRERNNPGLRPGPRPQVGNACQVFVKYLDDDIDDETLRKEFSVCGRVTEAKVMVDYQTQRSRGFGFVTFVDPREAMKAVTEMNGKPLGAKRIMINLAKGKDVDISSTHRLEPCVYQNPIGRGGVTNARTRPNGYQGTQVYRNPRGPRGSAFTRRVSFL